jgi:hypothetical protein
MGISPQIAELSTPEAVGLSFEGLGFGEEGLNLGPEGLRFPAVAPADIAELFPSYVPNCEQIVWDQLNDATYGSAFFPEDNEELGLNLPVEFTNPPDIGLFSGMDPESYPPLNGHTVQPVKVIRGWPAYPGAIPQIGVAIATENEDSSGRLGQAGFAGDAYARDDENNILATAAYYAEPLYSVIVAELIHENRDERDRLHDQLRRRLVPLRRIVPSSSSIIKEVQVQSEKQDLPVDEQPLTLYVSVFTVEMWSEALIPTEVVVNDGIIGAVNVTVEALA